MLTTACSLCGGPLDAAGEHAICAACRGMAPSGIIVAPSVSSLMDASGGPVRTSTMAAPAELASERMRVPVPEMVNLIGDGPVEAEQSDEGIRVFPDLFVSQLSTVFLVTCLISVLTIFLPVGLEARANPNLTPPNARPEWYFLSLYAFLHFVPTIIGIFAPIIGIIGLTALPFLDRNAARAPRDRVFAVASCAIVAIAVVALSVIGYLE